MRFLKGRYNPSRNGTPIVAGDLGRQKQKQNEKAGHGEALFYIVTLHLLYL